MRALARPRIPVVVLAMVVLLMGPLALGRAAVAQTAPADTPEERAVALIEPAMVSLQTNWAFYVNAAGQGYLGPYELNTTCSGFFVDPTGYVVTAGHCFDSGYPYGIKGDAMATAVTDAVNEGLIPAGEAEYWYQVAVANWTIEGAVAGSQPERTVVVTHAAATSGKGVLEGAAARVVESKPFEDGDTALVKVETGGSPVPVALMAASGDVSLGTEVLAFGYGETVTDTTDPLMKEGKITGKTTRGAGKLPVYETSADLAPGMSGGPAIDTEARVLGTVSFGVAQLEQNYLTPSSLVNEMLNRNGVKNELGPVDVTYREGLDAYWAGDYTTAGAKFDQVLARVPWHMQAQQFRTYSAEKAATTTTVAPTSSGGEGAPWLVIGLAVVVLLLLVGGGTALAMRARKPKAPVAPEAPAAAPTPAAAAPPAPAPAPPAPPVPAPPAPPAPVASEAPPPPAPAVPVSPEVASHEAGAAEPAAEQHPHFCSHCGTHTEPDDFFCPACGHPLHSVPS